MAAAASALKKRHRSLGKWQNSCALKDGCNASAFAPPSAAVKASGLQLTAASGVKAMAMIAADQLQPKASEAYRIVSDDTNRHVNSHMVFITWPAHAHYSPLTEGQARSADPSAAACPPTPIDNNAAANMLQPQQQRPAAQTDNERSSSNGLAASAANSANASKPPEASRNNLKQAVATTNCTAAEDGPAVQLGCLLTVRALVMPRPSAADTNLMMRLLTLGNRKARTNVTLKWRCGAKSAVLLKIMGTAGTWQGALPMQHHWASDERLYEAEVSLSAHAIQACMGQAEVQVRLEMKGRRCGL